MTKTYELSNERIIMADVDEEHHMATVSVYALDNLVEEANKADVLEQIREEIASHIGGCGYLNDGLDLALEIIDKYTKGEQE